MLMAVSTTHRPASDLGFLLHKQPDRPQRFEVAAGVAHVMYPESGADRGTVALLLEVDPVELVRSARGPAAEGFSLGQSRLRESHVPVARVPRSSRASPTFQSRESHTSRAGWRATNVQLTRDERGSRTP
jgi:hypothetical protein